MNTATKRVLEILKGAVDSVELDEDALNDALNSARVSGAIDQVELRAQLVKHISQRALKTTDSLIVMVQQVYDL